MAFTDARHFAGNLSAVCANADTFQQVIIHAGPVNRGFNRAAAGFAGFTVFFAEHGFDVFNVLITVKQRQLFLDAFGGLLGIALHNPFACWVGFTLLNGADIQAVTAIVWQEYLKVFIAPVNAFQDQGFHLAIVGNTVGNTTLTTVLHFGQEHDTVDGMVNAGYLYQCFLFVFQWQDDGFQ